MITCGYTTRTLLSPSQLEGDYVLLLVLATATTTTKIFIGLGNLSLIRLKFCRHARLRLGWHSYLSLLARGAAAVLQPVWSIFTSGVLVGDASERRMGRASLGLDLG